MSHRRLQFNIPSPLPNPSGNNVIEKPQDNSDPKIPAELKLNTIILFDTNDSLIKILCIRKNNVECRFFRIEIGSTNLRSFDLMETDIFTFESNYLKENQCAFLVFNSENLFCCAAKNYIKCGRFTLDNFSLIKEFSINMQGDNSFLTIKSNNNYIALFYMNNKEGLEENRVYEYYIYLPTCTDANFTLINSMNEGKEEKDFVKLSNLFPIKTNNYFLEFKNIPDNFGYFTLNGEKIEGKIHAKNENDILDFQRNKNDLKNGEYINIKYIVSVEDEEAYSKECTITFIYNCYHSCETCLVDINSSNETNHNCKKCKNNYYPSPEIDTNCYTENEKKINWYLDESRSKFIACQEGCKTCSSATGGKCLSCYDEKYLYKMECLDSCPNGTFPERINDDGDNYFKCIKCHENCENCEEKGDNIDMKCINCKDKNIKYKKNCYEIVEDSTKKFNDTEKGFISSCKEKFGLYIKEDFNECINITNIEEGYFLSNNQTGLLSKCHENCLTCSGINKDDSGNLVSMDCIDCKDINNPVKSMIRLNNNCFEIKLYTNETIIFDASPIIQEYSSVTCLDFGKAIYQNEYECIDKPYNTYYVLNNSENSGVIKNCHNACNSCYGENNTETTNCIECAPGYFITEYSDTNCILEKDIPHNYFLNITNKIYYECYRNCESCNGKYDSLNNDMHCLNCIQGYYFIYGEKNCYEKEDFLKNKTYYLSDYDNKFHECYQSCSECDNLEPNMTNHFCIKCKEEYYFLENTNNCYNENYTQYGYYLDNINKL